MSLTRVSAKDYCRMIDTDKCPCQRTYEISAVHLLPPSSPVDCYAQRISNGSTKHFRTIRKAISKWRAGQALRVSISADLAASATRGRTQPLAEEAAILRNTQAALGKEARIALKECLCDHILRLDFGFPRTLTMAANFNILVCGK
jgi:hypothetical protein